MSSKRRTVRKPNLQPPVEERALDAEVQARIATAYARAAENDLVAIALRIPRSLVEYLDRHVDRHNHIDPRRKYRKQDAGFEMFVRFYGEHPLPPLEDAMAFLKKSGIITVELRDISNEGRMFLNCAFIEPDLSVIKTITYPSDKEQRSPVITGDLQRYNGRHGTLQREGVARYNGRHGTL